MMTIKVENDETSLCIKESSKRLKFVLQEKWEAQDASDANRDMNGSEHSDELFDFLHKRSNSTYQDSATKFF